MQINIRTSGNDINIGNRRHQQINEMTENKRSDRVKLILQASNLRRSSFSVSAFRAKPCPFAVVSKVVDKRNPPVVVDQTEPIEHTLQPQWTKYIILDYEFGKEQFLDVSIYDDRDKKRMASTTIELGNILGRKRNRVAKQLNPYGTLFAQVVPYETPKSSRILSIKLDGELEERSGVYFEVQRKDTYDYGVLWTPIFRSETISLKEKKKRSERIWDCSIPFYDLATNTSDIYDSPIRIMFWNYRKVKRHAMIGSFETTITELMDASANENSIGLASKKADGDDSVKILSVQVVGADDTCDDEGVDHNITEESLLSSSLPLPPPIPVPTDEPVPIPMEAPMETRTIKSPEPSFLNYITGGCELDLSIAIDFTASNGDPRIPGTPHFIDPNTLNDYEKAIIACGNIVTKYDSDQMNSVWGFGAKYEGITRHAFQVGAHAQVQGVEGILNAYRSTFKVGLRMSNPVVYSDVIKVAANKAKKNFENARKEGKQSYTILLILTHGTVSDIEQTKAALRKASDAPLSIILVGIGQ